MLNSNYKLIMINEIFISSSNISVSKMICVDGVASTISGVSVNNCLRYIYNKCYTRNVAGTASETGLYLIYGKGTTQPTKSDFYLENPLTKENSNLESISVTKTYTNTSMYITGIIKNNGTESVTISEIGLIAETENPQVIPFMLGRIVLDTPVTLGVGETKTFTYEIS